MAMWWKAGTTVALTLLVGVATVGAGEPARGDAGDTMTLKLTRGTDAEVEDAHWRHHHHRAFYSSYFTPYAYSYYYPSYSYYYPYRSYYYPTYSSNYGYRSYRPYASYYTPPVIYYSTPAYCYPISLSATLATTFANAQRDRAPTATQDNQPPPRPPQEDAVGYPYDGGPKPPVPLPSDGAKPMKTPPAVSVPLEGRSVSLPAPKPKYTYTAFGEEQDTGKEDRSVASKKQPTKK
jgi:hypothetical protein